MQSQLIADILNQNELPQSDGSFGEETLLANENFIDEEEQLYPYLSKQNINNTLEAFEYNNEMEVNTPFANFNLENIENNYENINEPQNLNDEEVIQEPLSNYLSDQEIAEAIEHQVAITNSSTPVKTCEGRICWAKEALNNDLGLSLLINNALDEETKKAIGSFQLKNNLPQTQKIDPATERALLEADAIHRCKGTAYEQSSLNTISAARTKVEDFTKQAINTKPQYILDSYRDPRKVYAFVLHHMAFKRKGRVIKQYSDPTSYLSTGAHFCIMLDGRIIQLHAMSRMIWHGNCISPHSVAVEFEGNFPDIKGKWWIDRKSNIQNKDNPTQAQYDSGRFLASYLKIVLSITHILAHRQSSDSRENDPGPDIWYNVGQWAIEKLGLSDGGPTFKCGTGNPILPRWRTWGNKTVQPEKEYFTNNEAAEIEWEDEEAPDENYLNEDEYFSE